MWFLTGAGFTATFTQQWSHAFNTPEYQNVRIGFLSSLQLALGLRQ